MFELLPEDIRRGLLAAQGKAQRKGSRLSVHVSDQAYPILRLWDTGFAVDTARVPALRGFVDIYNGPRHILQALIIAAGDEDNETRYDFKRDTAIHETRLRDYADERPEDVIALPRPA